MDYIREINRLKREKDVIILAHYYTDGCVQEIADYVGDSYYLSKIGKECKQQAILFCGVKFMGESAKILSPKKTVLLADALADCPMAHMVEKQDIEAMRAKYEDLAVVCYINSTAEIKALSDVCVTSSNAINIVRNLKEKNIYFIPDEHLGRFVAKQVKEKNILLNPGFCHVHTSITTKALDEAVKVLPEAEVLVHPECPEDIVERGDYVGSTLEIINYVKESLKEQFIVCTELGILHELQKQNPNKKFYGVGHRQFCPSMKRITSEKIYQTLMHFENEVQVDEVISRGAKKTLERMHKLAN